MKTLVVVPARGGSTRFPGKNLHELMGIPLVAHPIIAAKNATLVDRVVISTDDERIARVAQEYGAEFPFKRPAEFSGDTSPVIRAIQYTLAELDSREQYRPDYIMLLQATTPIIEPEQVDAAIGLALEKDADSVINVSEIENVNHPYNIREIHPDGTIRFWQYDLHYRTESADRPRFYRAANLWLTSYDTIMTHGKLEGERNYPLIVPPLYSMDIDFKEDLVRVAAVMESRLNS